MVLGFELYFDIVTLFSLLNAYECLSSHVIPVRSVMIVSDRRPSSERRRFVTCAQRWLKTDCCRIHANGMGREILAIYATPERERD